MKHLIHIFLFMGILNSCCSGGTSSSSEQRNAMDVILHRTSVREYTSETVSRADIETMLRAGMAAPSAMNFQPWSFVVVDRREDLDAMMGMNKYARMLASSPLAIVVCGEVDWVRGGITKPNEYWSQDCSAVTQNILLAADHLGLGAVWTGCFPNRDRTEPLKQLLGIPSGVEPLSVIVVGHPAGEVTPKDKWKPEKIHWNRW